jgi:hypothetical protein
MLHAALSLGAESMLPHQRKKKKKKKKKDREQASVLCQCRQKQSDVLVEGAPS